MFQVGYLHDDVPFELAGWYAYAQYKGARISADNFSSPDDAAEALAMKLLTGARCACGKLVQLRADGAVAFERPTMVDGTVWTAEQAAAAGLCRWRRDGRTWHPDHEPVSVDMPRGMR